MTNIHEGLVELQDLIWEILQLETRVTLEELRRYKKQWYFDFVEGVYVVRRRDREGSIKWSSVNGWRYGSSDAVLKALTDMLVRYRRLLDKLKKLSLLKRNKVRLENTDIFAENYRLEAKQVKKQKEKLHRLISRQSI